MVDAAEATGQAVSETPRKRLKSLMDGLELPKGFKLTPARERTLKQIGCYLIQHGEMECYGTKVSYNRLRSRWGLHFDSKQCAALRGMSMSKWVWAELPPNTAVANRWVTCRVRFQDGIEQLARRLGARRILWDERKQLLVNQAEEACTVIRSRLNSVRNVLYKAQHAPDVGENDVLDAYRQIRVLMTQQLEAETELQRIRKEVENIPEPSEDDALGWLMQKELTRERSK